MYNGMVNMNSKRDVVLKHRTVKAEKKREKTILWLNQRHP